MNTSTESTRAGDAVARRVTISLATRSTSFEAIAGAEGVAAARKLKENCWKPEREDGTLVLSKPELMFLDHGLNNSPDMAKDFVFTGRVRDMRTCSGVCDLCGQEHLRFLFELKVRGTEEAAFSSVGSSCIYTYVYNALGVTTAEEAKAILDRYVSGLERVEEAAVLHRKYPQLFQDWKSMYEQLSADARSLRSKPFFKLAQECHRLMYSRHGYMEQASTLTEFSGKVLRMLDPSVPQDDPFVVDLQLVHKEKLGRVSALRLKQLYQDWPKELVKAEQMHEQVRQRKLQRDEEDRVSSVLFYQRVVADKQEWMTAEEKEFLNTLIANKVISHTLSADDKNRLWNIRNRTASIASPPEFAAERRILERCIADDSPLNADDKKFAHSLLEYLKKNNCLTDRQLVCVRGGQNGRGSYNKLPLAARLQPEAIPVS